MEGEIDFKKIIQPFAKQTNKQLNNSNKPWRKGGR